MLQGNGKKENRESKRLTRGLAQNVVNCCLQALCRDDVCENARRGLPPNNLKANEHRRTPLSPPITLTVRNVWKIHKPTKTKRMRGDATADKRILEAENPRKGQNLEVPGTGKVRRHARQKSKALMSL